MTKTPVFSRYQTGGEFNITDQSITTGAVWFVDSGSPQAQDVAGMGYNPDYPFATIDFAIGQCVAMRGDVIYVMPGHVESLSAAGSITCDVEGIKIIGLGKGADRPAISSLAAAGSVVITCAVWIENCIFGSGIDQTANLINVDASDVVIKDCLFTDITDQMTDCIVTTANALRLVVDGCYFFGAAAAGTNSHIAIDGAYDVEIKNCYFYGNYAVGAIDIRTAPAVCLRVHDCKFWTENNADIAIVDTITGSTGIIGPNLQIMLQENAANITEAVTGATFVMFDPVYVCNLAGEKAMLINWTASTD
jgi:hypothetical protein